MMCGLPCYDCVVTEDGVSQPCCVVFEDGVWVALLSVCYDWGWCVGCLAVSVL